MININIDKIQVANDDLSLLLDNYYGVFETLQNVNYIMPLKM